MENEKRWKCLSGNSLKWIAMAIMLVDHIAVALVDPELQKSLYWVMRSIGRLSFPLFCFLLVEGYIHTSNVRKYAIRLFLFAIISEYPFDLVGSGNLNYSRQNVFFTLFLGLIALWSMDYWMRSNRKGKSIYAYASIGLCLLVAYLLKTDYSIAGVLQIVILYQYRFQRALRYCGVLLVNIAEVQPDAFWSVFLMEMYNGKRGKGNKYIFYFFYPLHLLALYGIAHFLLTK